VTIDNMQGPALCQLDSPLRVSEVSASSGN